MLLVKEYFNVDTINIKKINIGGKFYTYTDVGTMDVIPTDYVIDDTLVLPRSSFINNSKTIQNEISQNNWQKYKIKANFTLTTPFVTYNIIDSKTFQVSSTSTTSPMVIGDIIQYDKYLGQVSSVTQLIDETTLAIYAYNITLTEDGVLNTSLVSNNLRIVPAILVNSTKQSLSTYNIADNINTIEINYNSEVCDTLKLKIDINNYVTYIYGYVWTKEFLDDTIATRAKIFWDDINELPTIEIQGKYLISIGEFELNETQELLLDDTEFELVD